MTPRAFLSVRRSPLAAFLAGFSLLLLAIAAPLRADPPPANLPPARDVIARADRLAETGKGKAYREACNELLAQAVQKALRGLKETPKGKFLCDFVAVIGADGRVKQAIVANDGFSTRLTDELRKLKLPAPPEDAYPLSIHWQLELRKK